MNFSNYIKLCALTLFISMGISHADESNESIFNDSIKSDLFERSAGLRDGLMSILIGIAARKSIDSNHPVRIDDLIKFSNKLI